MNVILKNGPAKALYVDDCLVATWDKHDSEEHIDRQLKLRGIEEYTERAAKSFPPKLAKPKAEPKPKADGA